MMIYILNKIFFIQNDCYNKNDNKCWMAGHIMFLIEVEAETWRYKV